MSQLTPSLLETHPTGTINTGGIINGNWTQLNNIFANTGDGAGVLADAMAGSGVDYVTLDGLETLTNKVLTSPVLNSPTLTGAVLGTPASGNLANTTVDGVRPPGFKSHPVRVITSNVVLGISDPDTIYYHPDTDTLPRTVTIPDNSTVPFPIGTEIVFWNEGGSLGGAGNLVFQTITDTLVEQPAGTPNLASMTGPGRVVLFKADTTKWLIWGTNLT